MGPPEWFAVPLLAGLERYNNDLDALLSRYWSKVRSKAQSHWMGIAHVRHHSFDFLLRLKPERSRLKLTGPTVYLAADLGIISGPPASTKTFSQVCSAVELYCNKGERQSISAMPYRGIPSKGCKTCRTRKIKVGRTLKCYVELTSRSAISDRGRASTAKKLRENVAATATP
jgi:hypothetical protein